MLQLGGTASFDDILTEDEGTARSRGYWIKSNYHRHDDREWWHRGWISDWRQAPYEIGDFIVLYLSAGRRPRQLPGDRPRHLAVGT